MSVSAFTSVFSPVSGRSRGGARGRSGTRTASSGRAASGAATTGDSGADERLPSKRELWDRVRDQAVAASELPEPSARPE